MNYDITENENTITLLVKHDNQTWGDAKEYEIDTYFFYLWLKEQYRDFFKSVKSYQQYTLEVSRATFQNDVIEYFNTDYKKTENYLKNLIDVV